ncbi:MAG: hypothetical protein COV52_02345 [Gammaproteobacteria bacterium CG11_big_fil_rev_8_21_14_0_20_46_22]|nr:MAG: hypothetical protein COW05_08385 [Gammaproteobacteria bacterium CG12_big_fil_rev_8_21_14_0_65_46_12]PIR11620.1 MAG: hypothetical protein COV52_02345 [Gammaproteobacteria bacterium CG11_big_fil_rev_8_21_14_0_20_46_22]
MVQMTPEKKQKIVETLNEKKAISPCPRCRNNNFTLMDGYFNQVIQQGVSNIQLSGPAIPSVIVVCNKCGYMSQHALGVLGLMPPKKDGGDNDSK